MGRAGRWYNLILPLGIISCVLVILVPMPAFLLDVLLAGNITLAMLVLLTTIYVKTPLEFSVFPSLILTTTLARLVLNVASTRLILTRAETELLGAAGKVIQSFGQFVTGDSIVVGLVIFVIIVVIQFVVITKGATRISEVAARFALDGMPGRQMAVDADLTAGVITNSEARRRRQGITQQADFFGAMDGASKFVRGDAIAGVVIIFINIAGGLFIGVWQLGMSIPEAAGLFTKLTIGDGLVSQVPAVMISLAAAMLVTRSSQATFLPRQVLQQLFSHPQALAVAAGFLGILVFTSLPRIPLLLLGGGCAAMSVVISRQQRETAKRQAKRDHSSSIAATKKPDRIEDLLTIDPIEMEIGIELIRLADTDRGGDLLSRISEVRRKAAAQIGVLLPKVRIRDNTDLSDSDYRIKIAGNSVAEGQLRLHRLLAIWPQSQPVELRGEPVSAQMFGGRGTWIETEARGEAETEGCTVLAPTAVLAFHLGRTVQSRADELLTRDATQYLIDQLKQTSPAVVEELIPGQLSLSEVQQVLQLLLKEGVPIRQLGRICEAIGDQAAQTKSPILLAEFARQRLARTICAALVNAGGRLRVATLDPELENRLLENIDRTQQGLVSRMSPSAVSRICEAVTEHVSILARSGDPQCVLVSPEVRYRLKYLLESQMPDLFVLSYSEMTRDIQVESVGLIVDEPEMAVI